MARIAGWILGLGLAGSASAQSLNLDIESSILPPHLGGGTPSASFGAAAAQPGYWNAFQVNRELPLQARGLDGGLTSAVVTMRWTATSGSGGGYFNPQNQGDFARLLNDFQHVSPLLVESSLIFTFENLAHGRYRLFTYSSTPWLVVAPAPVTATSSLSLNPQWAGGLMPGNGFVLGETHTVHELLIESGSFVVSVHHPANAGGMVVNGFQLQQVPEPTGVFVVLGGILTGFTTRRVRRQSALANRDFKPSNGARR